MSGCPQTNDRGEQCQRGSASHGRLDPPLPCLFPAPIVAWSDAPRRSADSPPESEPEHWVRVDDTPTPTDLATLVALGRDLLVELRTLTSTLGQRTEQEVPTRVNAWQEPKPLHSDVAGHYGGHEYRVPRGQS